MERTKISQIKSQVGKTAQVSGFVESIRDQGKIKFLNLRDVTGTIQAVIRADSLAFPKIADLTLESVISLEGLVKEEAQAPNGIEIAVSDLEILSLAAPELAIPVVFEKSGGEVDVSKRLDFRWLDLRRPEKQQIFKVWTQLEEGFRKYFLANDFVQLYTPSLFVKNSFRLYPPPMSATIPMRMRIQSIKPKNKISCNQAAIKIR